MQLSACCLFVPRGQCAGKHSIQRLFTSQRHRIESNQNVIEKSVLSNNLAVYSQVSTNEIGRLLWRIPIGCRYEGLDQRGFSHLVRHALFTGNPNQSIVRLTRIVELLGANISVTSDREHISLFAESSDSSIDQVAGVLANMVQGFTLEDYQLSLLAKKIKSDRQQRDVSDILEDASFSTAFRRMGLGNSIFATSDDNFVNASSIVDFYHQSHLRGKGHSLSIISKRSKDCIKLVDSVISDHEKSAKLSNKGEKFIDKSEYFGGEDRIEDLCSERDSLLISLATKGLSSTSQLASLHVIGLLVGTGKSCTKYGNLKSRIFGKLMENYPNLVIKSVSKAYSDAGLFSLSLSLPKNNSDARKDAWLDITNQVSHIVSKLRSSEIPQDLLASMQSRALADIENSPRFDLSSHIAEHSRKEAIQSLTTSQLNKEVKKLLGGKSTIIAHGDISILPYSDAIRF